MGVGTEDLIKQVERLLEGGLLIPSIQRSYVWHRSQIPRLLDSLYRGYPVGSLLIWETHLEVPLKPAAVLQGVPLQGKPAVLLDGQQRLTSLAWVYRPAAVPKEQKAADVRFDLRTERFLNPSAVQRKDPLMVPVADVLADDAQYNEILLNAGIDPTAPDYQVFYDRLARVHKIRDYPLAIQTYSSDDYEEVAEIFARVNTGGRRLSKGDLVMSAIAARWREGLEQIETFEKELAKHDFPLHREAILRLMGLLAGSGADHIRLIRPEITGTTLKTAWNDTEAAIELAVDFIKTAAHIPKSGLLTSPNLVVIPAFLLRERKGQLAHGEDEVLVRWLYTAMAFSHYSSQVETKLDAEASAIRDLDGKDLWDRLLRLASGARSSDAPIRPDDLVDKGSTSPLFYLLYVSALRAKAKDWWNNVPLAGAPIGRGHKIEYHHVIPKARVKAAYPKALVDSIANLGFLSALGNKKVGAKDPADYLAGVDDAERAKQWIPTDVSLWSDKKLVEFCAARRELQATALNQLLGLPQWTAGTQQLPIADEYEDVDVLDAEDDTNELDEAWAE